MSDAPSATRASLADLVRRHDRPGPRYTSYPTADRFGGVSEHPLAHAWVGALAQALPSVDLYVHVPFCAKLCTYCACTVVASKSATRKANYVDAVLMEAAVVAEHLPTTTTVRELQLGGGTPNGLGFDGLKRLIDGLRGRLRFSDAPAIGLEFDPREGEADLVDRLPEIGITRVSFGVQDVHPDVQKAIGRDQPFEWTHDRLARARRAGIRSVNVDLVYGLPRQTPARFEHTLDQLIALRPDRIALFSFAYVPWVRANQRRIAPDELPDAETKLGFYVRARERLEAEGWVAVGLDHFALPGDALAKAADLNLLRRDFQGYRVSDPGGDTLGLGATSIGDVSGVYTQNLKDPRAYEAAVRDGRLPIARGVVLSDEDRVRRWMIRRLMTTLRLDAAHVRLMTGLDLARDFRHELQRLKPLVDDGLCVIDRQGVRMTRAGQPLVRVAAMAFDERLHAEEPREGRYSRTV